MRGLSRSRLIAILLWADYSRFAMGVASRRLARRRETRETTKTETRATTIPARTSSQKWFAVASTQNQTQAGQTAQIAFDHQCRQAPKSAMLTIRASAAWRLGIVAYGFE